MNEEFPNGRMGTSEREKRCNRADEKFDFELGVDFRSRFVALCLSAVFPRLDKGVGFLAGDLSHRI